MKVNITLLTTMIWAVRRRRVLLLVLLESPEVDMRGVRGVGAPMGMGTASVQETVTVAADAPPVFTFESRPQPTANNPLGAKGCGEAGCAGSLPSVVSSCL